MGDISRERALRLNKLLDDWVPPRLRDSRPFAWLARRLYRGTAVDIAEFKSRAHYMSARDYGDFYARLDERFPGGETDLTAASLEAVVESVRGDSVLDVACGDGLLLARLSANHRLVIGCDVHLSDRARARNARLLRGNIEALPFRPGAFDTVVSTHTLEHVQHLPAALAELRRVTRVRLVLVVPRQRPYRVTFNPHIHFFPYDFSLLAFTGTERAHRLDVVGGDWLYVEEQDS